jgi:type I restriction enzyme S subunit
MANWKKVKLEEVCSVEWGNSELTKASYIPDGDYLAVSAAGCDGRIGHREHAKNTPVISAIGANCGRMFLPREDFTAIKNTITITPVDEVSDGRYLYEVLTFTELPKRGGAQPFMSKGDIESFKIPLPPLAEQLKIAEILRTWDEAIETAEAELKAKQERKRWLTQAVLSGSLRLKGCNKAWDKKRLDQVGTIVPGGTPSTSIPEYWNGDVPWVTPTEITKLKTPYIYNTEALITSEGVRNSSAALLPEDSLIVCTRATVGVCAINKVPMTTNQGFKSVVPGSTDDTLFLYYVLSSMQSTFNRLAQGSTFLEISKTQFEKMTIIWPSADERRLIASLMRTCDEQIESIGEAIEALRAQKRGLMQKLLTGEVRVAA